MSGQLDYALIRRQIPIRRVLELLGWEPATRRGARWRGPCPFCRSSQGSRPEPQRRADIEQSPRGPQQDRCFSVEAQRNLFHCFHCHSGGNQLDLWAAATHLPLYAATLDLCHRLGVTPVSRANPQPRT